MNLLTKLKQLFMARIEHKPIPKDDQAEALEAIAAYKKQNPVKYEAKKEALFARYGLNLVEDETKVEETPDENDIELAKIKAKVTKKAKAK
jgi:hypothetical protein